MSNPAFKNAALLILREAIDVNVDEAIDTLANATGKKWAAKLGQRLEAVRALHDDPNGDKFAFRFMEIEDLIQRTIVYKFNSVDVVDMMERLSECSGGTLAIMDQLCQCCDDLARKIKLTFAEIDNLIKETRNDMRRMRRAQETGTLDPKQPLADDAPTGLPADLAAAARRVINEANDALAA